MRIPPRLVFGPLSTFDVSSADEVQWHLPRETDGNDMGNYYNGYSWKERIVNWEVMKRLIANGDEKEAEGPCRLCGDPDAKVEYHSEDYGLPYIWTEPANYVLCHHCHVQRLHARFRHPFHWLAYLEHVRRGGYGSDLKTVPPKPDVKAEFAACVEALKKAYLEHVRCGGYGSDLSTDPPDPAQFIAWLEALKSGKPFEPRPAIKDRQYRHKLDQEWFAGLTMGPASLTGTPFRCRP